MDPVFRQLLAALMAQALAVARAEAAGGRRPWMVPAVAGDPATAHAAVAAAFSRAGVDQLAVTAVESGTTGQAMAARVQADYLSAAERAFRARHASAVRCRTHAAARRMGHATPTAGPIARVGQYAQDLLVAGAK